MRFIAVLKDGANGVESLHPHFSHGKGRAVSAKIETLKTVQSPNSVILEQQLLGRLKANQALKSACN